MTVLDQIAPSPSPASVVGGAGRRDSGSGDAFASVLSDAQRSTEPERRGDQSSDRPSAASGDPGAENTPAGAEETAVAGVAADAAPVTTGAADAAPAADGTRFVDGRRTVVPFGIRHLVEGDGGRRPSDATPVNATGTTPADGPAAPSTSEVVGATSSAGGAAVAVSPDPAAARSTTTNGPDPSLAAGEAAHDLADPHPSLARSASMSSQPPSAGASSITQSSQSGPVDDAPLPITPQRAPADPTAPRPSATSQPIEVVVDRAAVAAVDVGDGTSHSAAADAVRSRPLDGAVARTGPAGPTPGEGAATATAAGDASASPLGRAAEGRERGGGSQPGAVPVGSESTASVDELVAPELRTPETATLRPTDGTAAARPAEHTVRAAEQLAWRELFDRIQRQRTSLDGGLELEIVTERFGTIRVEAAEARDGIHLSLRSDGSGDRDLAELAAELRQQFGRDGGTFADVDVDERSGQAEGANADESPVSDDHDDPADPDRTDRSVLGGVDGAALDLHL